MVTSCGLLLWRRTEADTIEVLIGHMGGPFFARREDGAWSLPKGVAEDGESDLVTAEREFAEEIGQPAPPPHPDWGDKDLGEVRRAGKAIRVYARRGDLDPDAGTPGTFTMPWPPGGPLREFPELDRLAWLPLATARRRLARNQQDFIERLAEVIET